MSVFSLRSQRLLLAFAMLVPALLFAAAAWWNRAEVLREGQETVVRTATVLHEHARKVFDTANLLLSFVDERLDNMSWEGIGAPETSAFLRQVIEPLDQVVSIWVADANGVVHAGSHEWDPKNTLVGREWFEVQRQPGAGTHVGVAFFDRATNTASFAVSRRLGAPDGRFAGTVHLSLSPDYFARFFGEAAPPPHADVSTLFRADGAILAREPERAIGAVIPPTSEMMRRIAVQPDRGYFRAPSSVDGRTRLYAYRKVVDYPLYVGSGIAIDVLMGRWYENVAVYGMVTAAAAAILMLVSWLALKGARAERDALLKLKQESEQRLAAEQQLRHAQKMEGVGQLTGGIAHDFNNLLAVILGNLNLLRKRFDDEAGARLLDQAIQGAERGAALTQRLLAFARRQELSPRSIDVPSLVANMSDLTRRSLGPEIRIAADFPASVPPVRVDPNQLELALLNLMVNARDAMPAGGTITITARQRTVEVGDPSGLRPGAYVCIAVTDTGTGMDEATLARAADPFFTTKGVGKGTGLGLSMVQGLAVQSGGALTLESRPGAGTTATICLPQGEPEAERAADAPPRAADGRKCNVLVVDDDFLVASGTVAMLEDLGHVAREALSGGDALAALEAAPEIDLVITDQSMPGMTGLQLAARIRQRWPDMPILLASGHAELDDDFTPKLPRLRKPYSQDSLADAIAAVLTRDCKPKSDPPRIVGETAPGTGG